MFFKSLIGKRKPNKEDKESPVVETPSAFATTIGAERSQILNPNTIYQLYNNSVLLKRLVRAIVSGCLSNDILVKPIEEYKDDLKAKEKANKLNNLLKHCNKSETFNEIREQYLKDYLIYGVGGIEIEPSDTHGFPSALYATPGYCIKLNTDEAGNFVDEEKAYLIVDPNEQDKLIATLSYYSLVYFTYDKMSDKVYGESPVISIYNELMADISASQNLQNSNTLKSGVISIKRANKTVLQSLIEKLKQLIRLNARVKIAAISAEDAKFIDLTNATATELVEIQKWVAKKSNVYNLPSYILGIESEGATSIREQKDDFRALIEGIVKYEISKLNAILIKARLGWDDVEFYCPNFATRLTYERTRAAVRLVNSGIITPNEARVDFLGMKPLDDPIANKLKIDSKSTEED